MGNESMSAGQLLKQANRLKKAGRLDEANIPFFMFWEQVGFWCVCCGNLSKLQPLGF